MTITTLFYRQMLEANPDLRNVFSRSKQRVSPLFLAMIYMLTFAFSSLSVAFRQRQLARAVHAHAANIEDLTPILPVVDRISHKHTSVHIVPSRCSDTPCPTRRTPSTSASP